MKLSIWNSVRLRLLVCSIISWILAFITELAVGIIFYLLARELGVSKSGYGLHNNSVNMRESRWNRNFLYHLSVLRRVDNNTLIIFFLSASLFALLLFVFYFLLLSRKVSRDLNYIAAGITDMAEGNLAEPLDVRRSDEIGEIARRINELAERIWELMEAEREALQTNKDLITCVAHDLRTPLTSVIGYLQLAMDTDKYSVQERQKYARIASQKASRLEGMIQDLFSYTKLMSGEITLHRSDTDIVMLVEQMVEEFYPLFQENKLEYKTYRNVESLILYVDSELIARAVQNLISNAVKYGKDGKQVIIRLEKMETEVQISVTNFGLVIPPESIRLIFEKFYRVEGSRSRETGGTGLGLNISREIVLLHNGNIQVESGIQGTTFTIALPLEREKQSKESEGEQRGKGK